MWNMSAKVWAGLYKVDPRQAGMSLVRARCRYRSITPFATASWMRFCLAVMDQMRKGAQWW